MVRDEFGIDVREAQYSGPASAFGMGGSFALGAALPIVPYLFFSHAAAIWWSLGLAIVALFSIGAIAGRLAGRNIFIKGAEIVLYGAVVFGIAYLAGHYIPQLFGRSAISLGG